MEERKVPGKNELRKREPVIQVKNLYKVYRVGETKVYALNGVVLRCTVAILCDCRDHLRFGLNQPY